MNFQPGTRASHLNDLAVKAKQALNRGELDLAERYLRDPDAASEVDKKRARA